MGNIDVCYMHELFVVRTVENFGSYGKEREPITYFFFDLEEKANRWKTWIAPSGPGGPLSLEPFRTGLVPPFPLAAGPGKSWKKRQFRLSPPRPDPLPIQFRRRRCSSPRRQFPSCVVRSPPAPGLLPSSRTPQRPHFHPLPIPEPPHQINRRRPRLDDERGATARNNSDAARLFLGAAVRRYAQLRRTSLPVRTHGRCGSVRLLHAGEVAPATRTRRRQRREPWRVVVRHTWQSACLLGGWASVFSGLRRGRRVRPLLLTGLPLSLFPEAAPDYRETVDGADLKAGCRRRPCRAGGHSQSLRRRRRTVLEIVDISI
jgi:hypothetical protein